MTSKRLATMLRRAGRQVVANAVDPVKSDPEKAGTVNTTLEDGELRVIVAPEKKEASKETSNDKIKAGILGPRAEEGRDRKMSGYKIKQMITSLSEKADDAKTDVLSEKADEPEEECIKIEKLDKNDKDDELTPLHLIALKRIGH